MWGCSEKAAICVPGREFSSETEPCLKLDFGLSRTVKEKKSIIEAMWSVVFCYGSPRRLMPPECRTFIAKTGEGQTRMEWSPEYIFLNEKCAIKKPTELKLMKLIFKKFQISGKYCDIQLQWEHDSGESYLSVHPLDTYFLFLRGRCSIISFESSNLSFYSYFYIS